ncbi:orotate phosphoribosyltransferase [Nonlabens sp. MB-3u-79]|uniref:orotate phosphoribosyltransferase n=1 Tax=Nonlabens sp. MB-3u-79 TaxID=2058134 RepID=UPI000C30DD0E|nr:orotate phosphoribosyltransferase [Nonlabens sp. MB-3u-79]AUC79181.1 orotate phosphoribosyltransferase [Nonlabens sp. MB-3u-79]|tara:strand:- start:1816 stop:2202 length:387 start_codon:yes stop_codon:yes gene_type:complete
MNLESRVAKTQKNPEELYNFLIQVENFKNLMPEDTKFELKGEDKFLFGLKGMPEIALALTDKTPHSQVVLGSTSDKLAFTLTCNISETENGSEAQLLFNGDFNAMMAMMIKGPITKFLEQLANGLEKI